jgi:hypothetical protein
MYTPAAAQCVSSQIPPGPSTIAINGLGEECRGTCRFALLMAVARPSQPAAASAAAQMNNFISTTRSSSSSNSRSNLPFGIRITIPLFDRENNAQQAAADANNSRPSSAARFMSTDASNAGDSASSTDRSNFLFPRIFNPGSTTGTTTGTTAGSTTRAAAAQDFELPDVPTSALFDALAPRTVSAEVTLSGPQAEGLEVAVAVEGEGKTSDGLAVLAPKVREWCLAASYCSGGLRKPLRC